MSVSALKTLNNKRSDLIRVGEKLLVSESNEQLDLLIDYDVSPYIKEIKAKPIPQVEHHHTIKQGESLWTISRHYKVAVKDLLNWNSLTAQSLLKPGKVLMVFLPAPAAPKSNKTQPASSSISSIEALQSILRHGKPKQSESPN